MLAQLFSFFAFCSLALAAFGLGRPLLRGLGVGQDGRLSVAVWSIALGLIAGGMLLLGLGLLGGLYVPLIVVLTVAGCLWGTRELLRDQLDGPDVPTAWHDDAGTSSDAWSDEESDESCWALPSRWLCGGMLLAVVVAVLGSLVGAMAPPTAGDALCYHLELPKAFLAEHAIVYLPHHDNSTFPLLAEMWYLWGLALDGGVCAQLVHWGLGLLLALAAVVLATPILGRPWAWFAGAVVVLTPGVNNQMTAPLSDLALAALTTLALAAWWRAAFGREGRRWFLLAGLAAGGALGTKYVALVFAAAVGIAWLYAVLRQPGRRRLLVEGAAVVAVVALSVGGPWYARAAWHRGNPFYPLLGEVFRGNPACPVPQATLPESKSPLGRGPVGLVVAPWQVTMHPERFGGRGHQLGVMFLAAVPGLAFCRRLRGLGLLLGVALVYGVLWYLLRQNVRFLFPIVPLLAVVVIWVGIETRRFPRLARRIVAATSACVLAAMVLVPVARSWDRLAVAVGVEDRESYLLRSEPTYRAAAVFNALGSPEDHLLSQDYRAFYFDGRVTRENVFRRCTHYDEALADPAGLAGALREAGFTHLLLAETLTPGGVASDTTLSHLADAQTAAGAGDELFTLTDYCTTDPNGAVRHYRLVKLFASP